MQNTFQQITETIENLKLICGKETRLAQIEKDVVLENLRNLYLQIAALEVEPASDVFAKNALTVQEQLKSEEQKCQKLVEQRQKTESELKDMDLQRQSLLSAKQQLESEKSKLEGEKQNLEQLLQQLKTQVAELESAKAVVVPNPNQFSVQQGLTEDVDLFFDLDHESYGPEVDHVEKKQPVSEPKVEIPVQPKPVEEPKQTVQPTIKPAEVIDSKQVSDEDDLLQFIPSAKKSQPVQQPVAPKETKSQPTSVATSNGAPMEQSSAPRSLNDLFNAQKEDRSLGAQFQHAKVGDLTKAISINDKFTYIKELFNGRGEEFSASIQKLNQCANMEDAFNCLEGLKKQYYWDSTSTAYLSLCDLLRRKFV